MTDSEIRAVLAECEIGWPEEWTVTLMTGPTRLVRAETTLGRCSQTGSGGTGFCDVPVAGDSVTEVVAAARSAVCCMALHEIDERFTYRGSRVFDPHF